MFFKKDVKTSADIPPANYRKEISSADSSYYSKYALRPYNPDDLYQKRGDYSLFDKMREDDQISSLLNLKKFIILGADWGIECDDENIKEFIENVLKEQIEGGIIKHLYSILSAIDYGFSVTEKILDIVDYENKQYAVFTKLKTRAPHTFEFPTDSHGNLQYIKQYTDSVDLKLDPAKFILYSYNNEFDNPYGKSDLNIGVYRAYWSKDAIIKFWNIYCERFGMPTVKGKMPMGAKDQAKSRFIDILKNIQAKTAITYTEGFEIDLLEVAKGAGEYEKAINKYDTMIARKLLIPDLLGFSGSETSGGSYALGKKQFDVFYVTIDYIRNDIEAIVNTEIIEPLLTWNFGKDVKAKFVFSKEDDERKTELMKLWLEVLKTGKIPISNEQINWFYDKVDMPQISEKELEAIEEERKARADALQQQLQKPKEKDDKKDDKKEDGQKFAMGTYYRPLTIYEKRVDFAKIKRETEDIEDKYREPLHEVYKLSINALVDQVKREKMIEKKSFSKINNLQLKHMSKAQKLIKNMVNDSYIQGRGSVQKFKIIPGSVELNDEDIQEWIREYAFYVADMEEGFILGKAKPIIIEGVRGGQGVSGIVKMLDNALSKYEIGEKRLESLVRTTTLSAYNEGRAQQFEEIKDYITMYQYSAILDGRTSDICLELDKNGKGFYNANEIASINPPNHHLCRSILVPIFKDDEQPEQTAISGKLEKDQGNFWKIKK